MQRLDHSLFSLQFPERVADGVQARSRTSDLWIRSARTALSGIAGRRASSHRTSIYPRTPGDLVAGFCTSKPESKPESRASGHQWAYGYRRTVIGPEPNHVLPGPVIASPRLLSCLPRSSAEP